MPFLAVLIGMIVWGILGGLIGGLKGRAFLGTLLGAALGPIGLLLALFVKDLRERCIRCRGVVPDGATVCMHCGFSRSLITQATHKHYKFKKGIQ
jgi:hypothetical protein